MKWNACTAVDQRLLDALLEGTPFRRAALLAPPSPSEPAEICLMAGDEFSLVAIPARSPLAAGAGMLDRLHTGHETDLRQPHHATRGVYALAPLRYNGCTVAIAYVDDLRPGAATGSGVRAFAQIVEIASLARASAALARVDLLTDLPNRMALFERITSELTCFGIGARPFALAILDLDHFKLINDCKGHAAGDAALRRFAEALARTTRAVDFVARFAGDEFVLIVPGSDERAALPSIERALEAIHRAGVRCSIGVTTAYSTDTPDSILARADAALYAAKNAGRDRIVLAGDMEAVA